MELALVIAPLIFLAVSGLIGIPILLSAYRSRNVRTSSRQEPTDIQATDIATRTAPPRWLARSSGPIYVGLLHSTSGTMEDYELPLLHAERLAIDQINGSGGIHGLSIEPRIEDGASDAETFARKALELIDQGVSSIFGCWTSDSRRAVGAVVHERNNLLWYPLQYEGYEQSPNVVYTGPPANQQMIPIIDWCKKNNFQTVYLVGSEYIFPRVANAIVKKRLEERGLRLLPDGEKYVELGETNFEAIVGSILVNKPDIVINTINGDSNEHFYQQLKQAELDPNVTRVIATSLGETAIRGIGAENLLEHYAAWSYFEEVDSVRNRSFLRSFKESYGGRSRVDEPTITAYSQIYLFRGALEAAASERPQDIRRAAREVTYGSPSGGIQIDDLTMHCWRRFRIAKFVEKERLEIVAETPYSIQPDPFPYDPALLALDETSRNEIIIPTDFEWGEPPPHHFFQPPRVPYTVPR